MMRARVSMLLLLLGGCSADPGPATPNSVSARLAARSTRLSERAAELATRAEALGGAFDSVRAGNAGDQAVQIAGIRAECSELVELAAQLEGEARAIGASAQVY